MNVPTLFPQSIPSAALAEIPDDAVVHGEVFTRRWVVDTILDLVGYTPDRDLAGLRLTEPACGAGAFLAAIAERVSESCRAHERSILDAADAVAAYDLLPRNVTRARTLVERTLQDKDWDLEESAKVASTWVRRGDYLLEQAHGLPKADFVVGNPPYIRLEDVPTARMDFYRALYRTMVGRSDIYVGFFEAGLRSLSEGGRLGFICADRWMRNQYGRELRKLVADSFSLDTCITMHDADAFEEQVAAYPAITIITKGPQGRAVAADTTQAFGKSAARELTSWIVHKHDDDARQSSTYEAARLPHWFPGDDLWPSGSPARLALLEDLTKRFIPLGQKESGVRVGIGIATGADRVFITNDPQAVEPDRLLRLSMVRDTVTGELTWSGHYLINPWDANGQLIDLDEFPRLKRYFTVHSAALKRRYIAQKNPVKWYKTIDKVETGLAEQSKLLFPDMKLSSHPVLDREGCYPHHNLYFLTSNVWDLEVLGGLLLSKVAEAFVDAYAVKMRGRTLRFQAQYLRRIPVPPPEKLTAASRDRLAKAFRDRDVSAATSAALQVYGLSEWPS
ncbi:Eco57I restriction-modification methylase domain-containing protein [Nonomuraea insulae]|uniref:site-specific DNA-methyltransferase (adenine-specific) n=1 Tax=Nonomuraea insulae TaxID=1616787 RepID=A0ABW1D9I9_9ACTN